MDRLERNKLADIIRRGKEGNAGPYDILDRLLAQLVVETVVVVDEGIITDVFTDHPNTRVLILDKDVPKNAIERSEEYTDAYDKKFLADGQQADVVFNGKLVRRLNSEFRFGTMSSEALPD